MSPDRREVVVENLYRYIFSYRKGGVPFSKSAILISGSTYINIANSNSAGHFCGIVGWWEGGVGALGSEIVEAGRLKKSSRSEFRDTRTGELFSRRVWWP